MRILSLVQTGETGEMNLQLLPDPTSSPSSEDVVQRGLPPLDWPLPLLLSGESWFV